MKKHLYLLTHYLFHKRARRTLKGVHLPRVGGCLRACIVHNPCKIILFLRIHKINEPQTVLFYCFLTTPPAFSHYDANIGAVAVTGHSCDHVSSRRKSGHSDPKCHNVSKMMCCISYFHKTSNKSSKMSKRNGHTILNKKVRERGKIQHNSLIIRCLCPFYSPASPKGHMVTPVTCDRHSFKICDVT